MKTDKELKTTQVSQTGIRVAILKKPKLKLMALQHDYKNDGELYANVPWEEMNSVPDMVSGTRGYMFADLAKDGKEFYTIGVEVPVSSDRLIKGCFTRIVPASVYAVLYREPGTIHDVFKAAKSLSNQDWKRSTEIAVWSFDDNKDEGLFVFIPITAIDDRAKVADIPEIPNDPHRCFEFIKQHSQSVVTE